MYCCKVNIASPPTIYSLSPNPSPNGEGSEDHCLQIKGASRWCKERLSWIGRNALLKWRRAFPSFCPFVITIPVTMFLRLNNMSFKQYVFMSLKQVPLSLKYVIQKICSYVILSKKICFSVLKRRLLCLKPLFCLIVSVGEQR